MTIYVDELRTYPTGEWCHMWSDSDATELHAVASSLGLNREWMHVSNGTIGVFPHYDLRPDKRKKAIKLGVTFKPLAEWIKERHSDINVSRQYDLSMPPHIIANQVIKRLEEVNPLMVRFGDKSHLVIETLILQYQDMLREP